MLAAYGRRASFSAMRIHHNSKRDREDSQSVPESGDSSTASIRRDRRRVPGRGVVTRSGSRRSYNATTGKYGSGSYTDHRPAHRSECDKTERSSEYGNISILEIMRSRAAVLAFQP